MSNLGVLLADRLYLPELDEARRWLDGRRRSRHPGAMFNLGLLLADRPAPATRHSTDSPKRRDGDPK